jgi:hypothetical protein
LPVVFRIARKRPASWPPTSMLSTLS